ncbi:MAG: hypothetical protein BGO83_06820 [Devosia sp. 66-14]|nr:MAG: hypothetical protein BGO83_06820 [Devosia sp. 66-14]
MAIGPQGMVAQRAVEQTMVAIPPGEAPWAPEPPMVLKADGWAAAGAQQGNWQACVAQLPVQGSEQKHIDRPASLGSDACCWVDCSSTAATADCRWSFTKAASAFSSRSLTPCSANTAAGSLVTRAL